MQTCLPFSLILFILMRKHNFLSLSLATLLLTLLAACDPKKGEGSQENGPTAFEQSLNAQDSMAVMSEIDKFFNYLKDKKPYEAAGMLVTIKRGDIDIEAEPLSNQEMEAMVKKFSLIPVIDHKVQYLKFNEFYQNEAEVHITMIKGNEEKGIPDATTKMYLVPVMLSGTWKLAVIDTKSGDRALVKPGQRDSLRTQHMLRERSKP